MSKAIHGKRDELIGLAVQNGGNTRSDGKFDVDGATGTLAAYAEFGKELSMAQAIQGQILPSAPAAGDGIAPPRYSPHRAHSCAPSSFPSPSVSRHSCPQVRHVRPSRAASSARLMLSRFAMSAPAVSTPA